MFDRVTLKRDLVDAGGRLLARRGAVLSLGAVLEAAQRTAPPPRVEPLSATALAAGVRAQLDAPVYRALFRDRPMKERVERTILAARLPASLTGELAERERSDPARQRHGVATAAIAVRMLLGAVGERPGLADLAAAGLLHDLGMRHIPPHLAGNDDALDPAEIAEVASHPLLGGWHLALQLGPHPAVDAALWHHWRNGKGYPSLARPPTRMVEVVSVASAFAALTQARAFRAGVYDARGAVDLLIEEGALDRFDLVTVKLLVHALRGGKGEVREVKFGRPRLGNSPKASSHTVIQLDPRKATG